MRIGRVHKRVVPRVRPATAAAARYAFVRAHHETAASLAVVATGSGIVILILATRLIGT